VGPTRYRCRACGNLTRFDVVTTRRTRAFHHYTLGGEPTVEDEEVLSEVVEEVSCRWCGTGRAVEPLGQAAVVQSAMAQAAEGQGAEGQAAVGQAAEGQAAVGQVAAGQAEELEG